MSFHAAAAVNADSVLRPASSTVAVVAVSGCCEAPMIDVVFSASSASSAQLHQQQKHQQQEQDIEDIRDSFAPQLGGKCFCQKA
uniref:HDC07498 n=1 Tax=Drosophila melanogaster TaxID=7227 RepID=Q6IM46_DROME|nr:TPA_inf: HDC07498 [Drosophila melanogaster]